MKIGGIAVWQKVFWPPPESPTSASLFKEVCTFLPRVLCDLRLTKHTLPAFTAKFPPPLPPPLPKIGTFLWLETTPGEIKPLFLFSCFFFVFLSDTQRDIAGTLVLYNVCVCSCVYRRPLQQQHESSSYRRTPVPTMTVYPFCKEPTLTCV